MDVLKSRSATYRIFRSLASCSTTSPRCCATPKGSGSPSIASPGPTRPRPSTWSSVSRAAASSSAARSRIGSGPDSFRCASWGSCRRPQCARATRSSTARRLEIHKDAVEPGQRVLIVDDLLATGGTAQATVDLVKQLGGQVEGVAFLIELVALEGRKRLVGEKVMAVLQYQSRRCAPVAQQDRASVS